MDFSYRRISSKNCLSDVIRKVERVTDQRHPAEEIGQAKNPETARHVDDGPEVFRQRRHRPFCLLALFDCHGTLKGWVQL